MIERDSNRWRSHPKMCNTRHLKRIDLSSARRIFELSAGFFSCPLRGKCERKKKLNFYSIISREFIFISLKMSLFTVASCKTTKKYSNQRGKEVYWISTWLKEANKKISEKRETLCGVISIFGGHLIVWIYWKVSAAVAREHKATKST